MLIIAIPKSASTSLLETLGDRHGLPRDRLLKLDLPRPEELNVLPKYHSDVREFTPELMEEVTAPDAVYKQHLPPTERNRALVRKHRAVLLLREPEQIVSAHWRAEQRRLHPQRAEIAGADSEQEWRERAAQNGLLDDLRYFRDGWLAEKRNGAALLVLSFEEVVNDPAAAVARIEEHFGLPSPDDPVRLARRRYSRGVLPKLFAPLRRVKRVAVQRLRRGRR